MRHRARLTLLGAALAVAFTSLTAARRDLLTADAYLRHVRHLASDELRGRGNGTKELDRAAEYIASELKDAGLKPGVNAGFFQAFEIVTGLVIGSGNRLTMSDGRRSIQLEIGSSYYPLAATPGETGSSRSNTIADAKIVYAGYGISAKSIGYDDYASIDVRGKAVLVFTHEPQEHDPNSKFKGTQLTSYSTLLEKAMTAKNHGALALIVVQDPTHEQDAGTYAGFAKDPQAEDYGIPVLRVARDKVRPLVDAWGLEALAKDTDRDFMPRSRDLPGATLQYAEQIARLRRTVKNVIGVLPGSDPSKDGEYVVVGAHYDHLGLGGAHSLNPEAAGQIHNGADDNASGTAAIIEMARHAAAHRPRFPRSTIFMAFAGEELGLLGSSHFANHPTVPLDRIVAMINLDMVGRANGALMVSGLDTSPSLSTAMDAAAAAAPGITVKRFQNGAGVGASDDTSFVLKKVPALGFFSGFHADYHRPSDDWDKIDAAGAVQVMTIALELTSQISSRPARPEFIPQQTATHGPASTGDPGTVGGYGAYFGSVPDFAQSDKGVRFAAVRENSPAGKAGLRAGDLMVEFAGKPISSLTDFTYVLRQHNPGEEVEVKVMRDGQPLTVKVLLSTRP